MVRLLALINNTHSIPSKLLLDARSITQLLYMHSVYKEQFLDENTILLWKGNKTDLLLASKLINLPKNYHILDIDSKDKALFFNYKTAREIKNICKPISIFSNNQLCTSYASGMYFELLKSSLSVGDDDVIQFDDGLVNEIIEINNYRFLRFIIYLFQGFFSFPSKYRMFSDKRFKKIYTSINPDNIFLYESKKIVDISKFVSKNFYQISLEHLNIVNSKSAILMTTHSVESERMSAGEYRQLILNVHSKLKELGIKDIYLSKHPDEKCSNDDFYSEIGLILSYQDYPSELLVANKNITFIANPINSTIMMSDYLKHLNEIDSVISYCPKNSPHMESRIKMVAKILAKYDANHHVLQDL